MKIILQEKDSHYCGQACLAMLLGISLKAAFKLIGHSKETKTKELVKHFNHENLKRGFPTKTALCISRNNYMPAKGNWHWIVFHKDHIYCPSHGIMTKEQFQKYFYISSYINKI
jgi:hypothetical protein